jgi:hypothetical protein
MKSNKLTLMVVVAASVMLLAGCGNQSKSSQSSTQKETTTAVSKNKKSSSEKNSSTLWNDKKDQQLENFISKWAPTMNQTYTKYDGKTPIKTSVGATYPADLSNENVDDGNSTIGWSKTGKGNYDYNVVAIYDYNSNTTLKRITYFFAFHNGQPVALVDTTNNGPLMAAPTRNEKVASNFNAIATGDHQQTKSSGESSSSSKNTKTDSLERDPKLVGVMIYQYGHKISMDSDFASSLMFGPYEDKYSVSGGSGTSGLQFRIDGNTVTYWMLDPNSSDVDADKTQMEASVSLSQLENKYYATSAQKQEVKSYASEFRSLNN